MIFEKKMGLALDGCCHRNFGSRFAFFANTQIPREKKMQKSCQANAPKMD
jgi:hypothetical protein